MFVDIHLHTKFSFDSNEEPEKFIESAENLRIPAIGFSEHYDYDAVLDGEKIAVADLPSYFKAVKDLRAKYKRTKILFGIEFGYRDDAVGKYCKLIDEYCFDYVINSVHTVKGRGDCFHDEFFKDRPLNDGYCAYLKAVLESVKADFDYQIVGHIGYASRYRAEENSEIRYSDFSGIIDKILKAIIERDKCLEINTSIGKLKSGFLPDADIIKRYLSLGGEKLSFGSDAHEARDYLRRCGEAAEMLKSLGVKQLYYYVNRQPIAYNI